MFRTNGYFYHCLVYINISKCCHVLLVQQLQTVVTCANKIRPKYKYEHMLNHILSELDDFFLQYTVRHLLVLTSTIQKRSLNHDVQKTMQFTVLILFVADKKGCPIRQHCVQVTDIVCFCEHQLYHSQYLTMMGDIGSVHMFVFTCRADAQCHSTVDSANIIGRLLTVS